MINCNKLYTSILNKLLISEQVIKKNIEILMYIAFHHLKITKTRRIQQLIHNKKLNRRRKTDISNPIRDK